MNNLSSKFQSLFSRQQVAVALNSQMTSEETEKLLNEYYDLPLTNESEKETDRLRHLFSREELFTVLRHKLTEEQLNKFLDVFFDSSEGEYAWSIPEDILDELAQLSPRAAEYVARIKRPNPIIPIVMKYYRDQAIRDGNAIVLGRRGRKS
jgi:hypothetical protein